MMCVEAHHVKTCIYFFAYIVRVHGAQYSHHEGVSNPKEVPREINLSDG